MNPWNRLAKEFGGFLLEEVFKNRVDKHLFQGQEHLSCLSGEDRHDAFLCFLQTSHFLMQCLLLLLLGLFSYLLIPTFFRSV